MHASLPQPVSAYISPLDYPASALPLRSEGRVDFTLEVDSKGRVSACTIRKSSGSAILDAATCRILRRRLKFNPARSASGEAQPDVIETSIEWHLPPPDLLRRLQDGG
ncbi:MAG TPA: energy transducer TonB [Sphingomicrobium sp.]|nr:energy transducer TonB [Sphingomicrobium sp.]